MAGDVYADSGNVIFLDADGHIMRALGIKETYDELEENMGGIVEINLCGEKVNAEVLRYFCEEGGRWDDLREDGLYLIFEDDALYEKKEKPIMQKFREIGCEPKYQRWTGYT